MATASAATDIGTNVRRLVANVRFALLGSSRARANTVNVA
jgi:hypothetical protein